MRVLLKDLPKRAVALASETHVLTFRPNTIKPRTTSSTQADKQVQAQCTVEFSSIEEADLTGFISLSSLIIYGTLGLIQIKDDTFLCVVNGSNRIATTRPGENVLQITSVDFHCISRSDNDFTYEPGGRFPTHTTDVDGNDDRLLQMQTEHPCLALKKLLSGGTFYYSADFDLTRRLQDRSGDTPIVAIDSFDRGFLWNAFMIAPLVKFRSKLAEHERQALDESKILTSAIRGFAMTLIVPSASSPISTNFSGRSSSITLISRLSCRRAGTRFNARGIDDNGNVANFVETETLFWAPTGLTFSYVQTRGSVPVFWEQTAGFTPSQQKIHITRPAEATQPAFDKHFDELESIYDNVHIVNLLGNDRPGESDLTKRYHYHVQKSPLNERMNRKDSANKTHALLTLTDFDFHAEVRGQSYEAAHGIRQYLQNSVEAFVYFLAEQSDDKVKLPQEPDMVEMNRSVTILQQQGVFRTNCLDCLDRTNLIQTIISQMALEQFISHRGESRATADFFVRHSTLWADNGDALSKIYTGTGALKSSFTRSGKMSLAGALADVRKSATRLYINNFEDTARQNVMDILLGRLIDQVPVVLYDPINDYVAAELQRRVSEYTSKRTIQITAATFNVNGYSSSEPRTIRNLESWLCPYILNEKPNKADHSDIVAVGFQEIVELSPQQIMSTDPNRRLAWDEAVKQTLNKASRQLGTEEYVVLRSGQLVGASLSIFVRANILPFIINVEGSLKKTGMSGMAGNKGAVAIRMEFAHTSICFVTAHLAAGFANYEERNQDYQTISTGLRFTRNRGIEDHDSIIWLGDFNYRIGMTNEKVRQLIKIGDLSKLYESDQLHLQMMHGRTFPHYYEARIAFKPTYKYNNGTDEYDSGEKARIPAWCDRILSKGNNLRQICYDTAPLKFSDHRPVYARFECVVSVVDEALKNTISTRLFFRRRTTIAASSDGASEFFLFDNEGTDELVESIEQGLPPPSSDKQKWWLEGGLPSRSNVRMPSRMSIANPERPSNPFTSTPEPDWIDVQRPSTDSDQSFKTGRVLSSDSYTSTSPSTRIPLQRRDTRPPPPLPTRFSISDPAIAANSRLTGLKMTNPPLIPRKPAAFRTFSVSSGISPGATSPTTTQLPSRASKPSSQGSININDERIRPSLPPSRRSNGSDILKSTQPSARTSQVSFSQQNTESGNKRSSDIMTTNSSTRVNSTKSDNIIDVQDDDLKDWTPLKPI